MSVAVRSDFDYASAVRQGARLKVATKYVSIARDFFAAKGVHVDLIKLYGSMELAPLTGLADADDGGRDAAPERAGEFGEGGEPVFEAGDPVGAGAGLDGDKGVAGNFHGLRQAEYLLPLVISLMLWTAGFVDMLTHVSPAPQLFGVYSVPFFLALLVYTLGFGVWFRLIPSPACAPRSC